MSKRLSFLFMILVLSLSVAVQGQTTIEVINPSFEWADEVNLVTCHGGLDGVLGWTGGSEPGSVNPTWSGVDVNCGWELACGDCRDWHVFPDGNTVAYMDMGTNAYQLTDATITVGYKYTLTFDGMTWWSAEGWSQPIRASFYYPEDVCAPDVNHTAVSETVHIVTGYEYDCGLGPDQCLDDWEYGLEAVYIVRDGDPAAGEKLGIKIGSPSALTHPGSSWAWVDNVSLTWEWATEAFDPNPEDGAELVSKNPTLSWTPGLWAAQHEVYFGTDETAVANADSSDTTGIYQITQDPNSYTPSGPLVLGETYYWKITEVNSGYSGPVPPPWEGDVWSFRVEGHAYDPSPEDGAVDVPFLGLELEWSAGTDAENHVVYFGTDETAVANATTSSPEYETTLSVGTENYAVAGSLTVGQTYYWRIDEKSAGGSHIITGDVWRFTVGEFLLVENFESYINNSALYDVWDDYWTNSSGGEIFLERDVNIVRDPGLNPQAILCWYTNSDKTVGSYFDVQDMTELEIGSDWTVGGVKALQLQMRGDPCTVLNSGPLGVEYSEGRPWVELEDTSSNTGYVLYPEENVADILEDSWHEWNVDLGIIDACGVELSAIDRFTIGIGGAKAGQSKANKNTNNMWFDDIRLYPPRCIPEYGRAVGNLTEGDCVTDGFDLEIMATDWMVTDKMAEASPPVNPPEVWYKFDEGTGSTVVSNSGSWGSEYDISISYPNTVNEPSYTSDVLPPLQQGSPNYAMWFHGADYTAGGDYLVMPSGTTNMFAGTQNMTVTAWVKRDGDQPSYGGVVVSEDASQDGRQATGLIAFGQGGDELNYFWNEDYWQWKPGLIVPDNQWAFMAVAVEPTQATAFVYDGTTMQQEINTAEHGPLEQYCAGCENWIGSALKRSDDHFNGKVDDIRMYKRTLTVGEVYGIAGMSGEVYVPNTSVANISPKDPCLSEPNYRDTYDPNNPDIVQFLDYEILASNWLEEYLWPPQ